MSFNFIPPVGHAHDIAIRDAYAKWLSGIDFDWFVTLTFAHAVGLEYARNRFHAWIGRIDRRYLKRRWFKSPNSDRTLAWGVIENPTTNLHLHLLLKMSPKAAGTSPADQIATFGRHWSILEPAGDAHIQQITHDLPRVVGYVFKQLTQQGHIENCILYAPE